MMPDREWLARFRKRLRAVTVRGGDGHLLWKLSTNHKGYAQVRVKWDDGRWSVTTATRIVAYALIGELPEDKERHHVCPVHRCVEPAHGQWADVQQHNNRHWR